MIKNEILPNQITNVIGIYPTDKKDVWGIINIVNSIVNDNKIELHVNPSNFLVCNFEFNNNTHKMIIKFDEDKDYFDSYPGPKIIFSIHYSDKDAEEIIRRILKRLSIDRNCYFISTNKVNHHLKKIADSFK